MAFQFGPTYSNKPKISKFKLNLRFDSTTISLIIVNVLTIFLALSQSWNLAIIIWTYWFQSIFIGIFTFIKILNLKNFSTENFRINRRPVEPTKATKNFTAFFFLIHYGIFHIVYLSFLLANISASFNSIFIILLTALFFLINHLFSFIKNFKADTEKKRNIGAVMFFPYLRVFPMHFFIVTGGLFFSENILVFLILKTLADVIMHMVEHNVN